ncbi:MAG: hypothetical protein IJ125_01900 [Atopobiaceae bacterium]|nr:hypothetical protein [Atopobiaceae bacterium]
MLALQDDVGGAFMARRSDKKRMTLSEHRALRAQAAEETKQCEDEHTRHNQSLKELRLVTCTCPTCMKLRAQRR